MKSGANNEDMGTHQHHLFGSYGRNVSWAMDRIEPVDEDFYA